MRSLARSLSHAALAAALSLATLPALAARTEDGWITTKVKVALLTDDSVDGVGIDVDTVDGLVTLHGKVDSKAEKAEAEVLARDVEGVVGVRNLLAVVPPVARKRVEVSDETLRQQVSTVLKRDKALASSEIHVKSVHDGLVLLVGRASTLAAHQRALEDARAVLGVRQVASEIRSSDEVADAEIWEKSAKPEPRAELADAASDAWITTKAKLRLLAELGLTPLAVSVDTRRGVVMLFGAVETQDLKSRAEAEVQKVAGVLGVENDLQVVPAVVAKRVEAADDRVEKAVRERLGARDTLEDAKIDVAVENGVVRLTGTVASQRDRLMALTVARNTIGVGSVIDGLELKQPQG
jgi:hyperosmotically inducible protein